MTMLRRGPAASQFQRCRASATPATVRLAAGQKSASPGRRAPRWPCANSQRQRRGPPPARTVNGAGRAAQRRPSLGTEVGSAQVAGCCQFGGPPLSPSSADFGAREDVVCRAGASGRAKSAAAQVRSTLPRAAARWKRRRRGGRRPRGSVVVDPTPSSGKSSAARQRSAECRHARAGFSGRPA